MGRRFGYTVQGSRETFFDTRRACRQPNCNRCVGFGELMSVRSSELELQALMVSGLDGDANAYRALLVKRREQLRAYFKGQLIHFNRGTVEAEDLVQEALMAILVA